MPEERNSFNIACKIPEALSAESSSTDNMVNYLAVDISQSEIASTVVEPEFFVVEDARSSGSARLDKKHGDKWLASDGPPGVDQPYIGESGY